jgi:tetratricopeptide (TPR) repeat protein
MRLTASSIVSAAAVLLAGLAGFVGREAWAQAAAAPAAPASTTPAPAPAPTPDQLMATAQQQLRAGDRAGAIASLRSAVALDPKHGSAGLLITTLHQDDRIEEAYAIGDRYRREGPRNPRALFRFGWVLAFTGEIARAEALYRDLVVLDKGGIYEAWGNGELSYLARARGEPALAVEHMRRAVAAKPDDVVSRVGLAQMMINAGAGAGANAGADLSAVREAVPLLEAELAKNPAAVGYGGMPAPIVLGWAYRLLGDDAAAAKWFATLETARAAGAWAREPARELAFLAVSDRRDEALQLAARTPHILLYGAPDPHDRMFDSLVGAPEYEALLQRSRSKVDAERKRLGWGAL